MVRYGIFPKMFNLLCWPVFSPHMEGARLRAAAFEMMSSSAEQRLKPPSPARGGPRMLSVSKSNRRTQMSEEKEWTVNLMRGHTIELTHSPGEDFLSRKEQVSLSEAA